MARLPQTWEEFDRLYAQPSRAVAPAGGLPPTVPSLSYARGTTARALEERGINTAEELTKFMGVWPAGGIVPSLMRRLEPVAMAEPRLVGRVFGLKGKKSLGEALQTSRWGQRHPRAAVLPALAADILLSPTTYLTSGLGGYLKAAQVAGRETAVASFLAKGGSKVLAPEVARIGAIAGHEGVVGTKLVETYVRPLVSAYGLDEKMITGIAKESARAGNKAAQAGVRWGIGKRAVTLVGRGKLREAVELVSGAAAKMPGYAGLATRLGRFARPGYIQPRALVAEDIIEGGVKATVRATGELPTGAREMTEEAIRRFGRRAEAAAEMGRIGAKPLAVLKEREERLVSLLRQLPEQPAARPGRMPERLADIMPPETGVREPIRAGEEVGPLAQQIRLGSKENPLYIQDPAANPDWFDRGFAESLSKEHGLVLHHGRAAKDLQTVHRIADIPEGEYPMVQTTPTVGRVRYGSTVVKGETLKTAWIEPLSARESAWATRNYKPRVAAAEEVAPRPEIPTIPGAVGRDLAAPPPVGAPLTIPERLRNAIRAQQEKVRELTATVSDEAALAAKYEKGDLQRATAESARRRAERDLKKADWMVERLKRMRKEFRALPLERQQLLGRAVSGLKETFESLYLAEKVPQAQRIFQRALAISDEPSEWVKGLRLDITEAEQAKAPGVGGLINSLKVAGERLRNVLERPALKPVGRYKGMKEQVAYYTRMQRAEVGAAKKEIADILGTLRSKGVNPEIIRRKVEARGALSRIADQILPGDVGALGEEEKIQRLLSWARESPENLPALAERYIAELRPGYREAYIPGRRAAEPERLPVRRMGQTPPFYVRPKTYPTLLEREYGQLRLSEKVQRLGKIIEREQGNVLQIEDVGEQQAALKKIGLLRDRYANTQQAAEWLIPREAARPLLERRLFESEFQAAKQEMFDTVVSSAALPKEIASQHWVETSYPQLRGYKVPAELSQALQTHFRALTRPDVWMPGVIKAWVNTFRWQATAGTPGWWLSTNPQGNIFNAVVHGGMNPVTAPYWFYVGAKMVADANPVFGGPMIKAMMRNPQDAKVLARLQAQTFKAGKEMIPYPQLIQEWVREGGMQAFGKAEIPVSRETAGIRRLGRIVGVALDSPRNIATWQEQMAKAALFAYKRSKGLLAEDAGQIMKSVLFHYSELTRGEQVVRGWIAPFYVWAKNNTGLQLQSFIKAPGKPLGTVRFVAAMNRAQPHKLPEDLLPDWMQERGVIALGGKGDEYRYLTHQLPLYDITRVFSLKDILSQLYPVISLPFELLFERGVWGGQARKGYLTPLPAPLDQQAGKLPESILKPFGIVQGQWPVGTGRKAWLWPETLDFAMRRLFPYYASASRFAERPLPREQERQWWQVALRSAPYTLKGQQQIEAYQAKQRRGLATLAARYRTLGILPPTPTQKRRAGEFLQEMEEAGRP